MSSDVIRTVGNHVNATVVPLAPTVIGAGVHYGQLSMLPQFSTPFGGSVDVAVDEGPLETNDYNVGVFDAVRFLRGNVNPVAAVTGGPSEAEGFWQGLELTEPGLWKVDFIGRFLAQTSYRIGDADPSQLRMEDNLFPRNLEAGIHLAGTQLQLDAREQIRYFKFHTLPEFNDVEGWAELNMRVTTFVYAYPQEPALVWSEYLARARPALDPGLIRVRLYSTLRARHVGDTTIPVNG